MSALLSYTLGEIVMPRFVTVALLPLLVVAALAGCTLDRRVSGRYRNVSVRAEKTKPPRDSVGGGSLWYLNDRGCS
jgi:hypothetical protein